MDSIIITEVENGFTVRVFEPAVSIMSTPRTYVFTTKESLGAFITQYGASLPAGGSNG